MSTRKRKFSESTTSSKMYNRLYKKQKRSYKRLPRSLSIGAPDEMTVKLVYHDFYTHTHTSGALNVWQFRGNSVYDPDFTYTGHQPNGFDEMATLYQRYRVSGSLIQVNFSPLSSSGSNLPMVGVVVPRAEDESISSLNAVCELPYAKMVNVSGNTADSAQHWQVSNYMTTKKMFGIKDIEDLDYSSVVTSNPTAYWLWSVYTDSSNEASTSIVAITVKITYYVKFYKKQATKST